MRPSAGFRRSAWIRALARAWPFAALSPAALANPAGGTVIAGDVSISAPNAVTVQIDQATPQAIVNWTSFSVGADEFVQFNQPDSSSVILNRVVGGTASVILGHLTANGQVFLLNPQGVLFGAGSQVDVAGIVASTLEITDNDFLAANYALFDASQGSAQVRNQGTITATDFGYVILAADRVESEGLIVANFGHVLLASGSALTLTLDTGSLVDYVIDAPAFSQAAGVDVSGEIIADGGRVILAASTAQDLAHTAVNLTGRVRAEAIEEQDGVLSLVATGGSIELGGEALATQLFATADGSITGAGDTGPAIDAGELIFEAGGSIGITQGSIAVRGEFLAMAGSDIVLPDVTGGSGIELTAGRDISTGDLSARRIAIGASNTVATGALEVINEEGVAGLRVVGLFGVQVGGNVTVRGNLVDFTGGSSSDQVAGASVFMGASSGGIQIEGDLVVEGSVGTVQTGFGAFVRGADVNLVSSFGSITVGGLVDIDGTVGDVTVGELASVGGAGLDLFAVHGGISVGGALTVSGITGDVNGGSSISVAGGGLSMRAGFGSANVGGDLSVTGDVGAITAGGGYTAVGASVLIESLFQSTHLQGVTVAGNIASVEGSSGVFVSGASIKIAPDGDLDIDGDVDLSGSIGSVNLDDHGGAVGADLLMLPFFGQLQLDGAVSVEGSIGSATLGSDSFASGALATFVAFGQGSDEGRGSLHITGPVTVVGTLGETTATDFVQLGGATLWVNTSFGNVSIDGAVDVDGTIGSAIVGREVALTGATVFASSAIGTVTVHDIDSNGTVLGVDGIASVAATGADVVLQARFPGLEDDAAALRMLGTITQTGTILAFSQIDNESGGGAYAGAVLADSGLSAIRFGNITGDNVFLAFDSDSQIGDATVEARQYLEMFTASLGPTLSGGTLELVAPNVFLGANVDVENLAVDAAESLTVYLANVHGGVVDLQSGGNVTLLGLDPAFGPDPDPDLRTEISGDVVRISGESVFGDERATIVAGGLDIRAQDTILLEGRVQVGSGNAGFAGDLRMIALLQAAAPDLVPASAGPNAYFSAHTVALAQLELTGDWLHIESEFTSLGEVQLQTPHTLVHLDPLVDLPFFAESVDVDEAGLTSVQDRIRTDGDNQVVPNFGSFDDVRGSENVLGGRPALGTGTALAGSELDFEVGTQRLSFGELILSTGLAGSTIAIGASDYNAGIQLSDRLEIDVRPSDTNFMVLTTSGILGVDRIQTNGRVIVLGGTLIDSRDQFYAMVRDQILAYAALTAAPKDVTDDGGLLEEEQGLADDPACR